MRGSWSDFSIRDTINWVDRSSPPNSPVLEPEKAEDITPPTQLNQSVDNYFKMIKVYATVLGVDLDNQDLKGTFFKGLLRENKKEVVQLVVNLSWLPNLLS